ncbi:MAG: dockerin type I repeat-containing protein [Oscillospiraceae bacterium]|nr:dockerin type I repeat-containing protein [Oscillospiraceae bacterium]
MKIAKRIIALISVLALILCTFSAMVVFAAPEQEINVVIGDVNLDGEVAIKDATLMQKVIAGISEKPDLFDYIADVTGDGKADIRDATTIQRFINGSITKFPVEQGGNVTESTTRPHSVDPTATDPDGWFQEIIKP